MLTPDTVLQGRYRVVRQLGQGGMGTVFEAIDERLDTTVALKQTLFGDERLRKQFEREARLLARLHHPALPRVSDHFSEGEGQFLVMQFIAGQDLAEMIDSRRSPFPAEQVLTWADQLLDALDYLHTQDPQIIHRDIKPQNLKLTARGQIILLDFGLAKGQASEISRVTTSASIFGYTPNYAPLEQIQGLGTDPRSDIYALSATLYHLITGVKPPDALTRATAVINAQPDPLLPANEVNSAVSVDTAKLLERAMAQNREQRYPTAAVMRKALQGTTDVETVTNRSEANTVLFPPAAAAVATPTQHNLQEPTLQASGHTVTPAETTIVRPAPRKRISGPLFVVAGVVLILASAVGYYAYRNRQEVPSPNTATPAPQANANSAEPANQEAAEVNKSNADPQTNAQASPSEPDQPAVANQKPAVGRTESRSRKVPVKEPPEEEVVIEAPDAPDIPVPTRPSVRRQPGGVTVRTFADGTQVITSPNGSRMVVRPDGTRELYGPRGQRLEPRKVPPKY